MTLEAEHGRSGRVGREKHAEPKGCLRKRNGDRKGSFRWSPDVASPRSPS